MALSLAQQQVSWNFYRYVYVYKELRVALLTARVRKGGLIVLPNYGVAFGCLERDIPSSHVQCP